MSKSIVVFCPNPYSLYTNSVCELLMRRGYKIDLIVVRKFSFRRFRDEFTRDGKRLLRKIWTKLFLKDRAYDASADNIVSFRIANELTISDVRKFKVHGTQVVFCKTLNDSTVAEHLRQHAEKIVVFTGGGIIRKNILDCAGDGIINCHMGVLPKYRGMDLPEWCILENEIEELGVTLHLMDTGIDTGEILKIVKVPQGDHADIKSLRDSFEAVMVESMVSTVDEFLQGKIEPIVQPASERRQYFIVHEKLRRFINGRLESRVNRKPTA